MRWSQFLIPTTKEVPKDAVVPSHQLMLRAGLIRQLAAGIYSYLPLGYRTLRKVEAIVRDEMNRAGAIELHMPVLHPKELWQQTGRTTAMGDVLLGLRPVKDGDEGDWRAQTVLGPTHEEPVTEIARAYLNSYKMLPVNLYQIQVKFRGEARPKSGVLRTREFLMKDAYSFHRDKESLDEGYQRMYDAYCRIFARCGLPYIACEAESGPIGGDASHEFMVLTEAGEDVVALSENGDYAANTERAVCAPLPTNDPHAANEPRASARAASDDELLPLQDVHTPNQRTIDEVCAFLKVSASRMIKSLIYEQDFESLKDERREKMLARHDGIRPGNLKVQGEMARKRSPLPSAVVVLVRGDHEVNENKLKRILTSLARPNADPVRLKLADNDKIEKLTGAAVGFAGPHTLGKTGVSYRLIVDQAVAVMRNAATGANKTDYHTINVNPGRDFPLTTPPPSQGEGRGEGGVGGQNPLPDGRGSEKASRGSEKTGRGEGGGDGQNPLPDGRGSEKASRGSEKASRDEGGGACQSVTVADVRNVVDGDLSPTGSKSPIRLKKAIEIGHVFKLGTKYSDAMEATFLDNDGKPKSLIMGCYGIGLNRIMAAAIEAHHDENGIIWPASIAPFSVLIVALDPREEDVMNTAQKLHDELEAAGIDVLFDDRDERAGFKFKDADLIGIPVRITVGRKSLAEGVVELKRRDSAEVEKISPYEASKRARDMINTM